MGIDTDKSDFENKLRLVVETLSDLDDEYNNYLSKDIDALQNTEEELLDKVSDLEANILEKDNIIDRLEEDKNNLEIEISEAITTIASLENEIQEYADAQPPI